ncbi:MAG: hypothetical protein Ct9H300mP11_14070 [Chloroflexota bacterium]|nr:MAG: hypothetical protein Ct9H300mP11_14070 [Chloroflexota bacterium]
MQFKLDRRGVSMFVRIYSVMMGSLNGRDGSPDGIGPPDTYKTRRGSSFPDFEEGRAVEWHNPTRRQYLFVLDGKWKFRSKMGLLLCLIRETYCWRRT